MDKNILNTIQTKLEDQKNEITGRIEELRSSDPFNLEQNNSPVMERSSPDDDAQINEAHERMAAQLNTLEKQLVRIDSALDRIKHGTYGVCEVCGKPIEETRLSIMPLASLCMADEKQIETRIKKAL